MATHRGNVSRLPLPPKPTGTIPSGPQDVQALYDHMVQVVTIANQGLQNLQNRVNTIQQSGAQTPPTVSGLTVTGKQGCFWLTWNRVKNVDGYVVEHATDAGMTQLVGRYNLPDSEQCIHQISVGNVATTGTFRVYAYQSRKMSDPSSSVTATTAAFGAGEAAIPSPPLAPRPAKIAPPRSGPNL